MSNGKRFKKEGKDKKNRKEITKQVNDIAKVEKSEKELKQNRTINNKKETEPSKVGDGENKNVKEDNKDIKCNKNKANNKNSNIRNNIFIIFFVALLIFSCAQIVMWYLNTKKDEEGHQQLLSRVVTNINTNLNTVGSEETISTAVSIDFEELAKINKGVVGWIIIDGTNINYPILQASDNDYYLRRDINKSISKAGSIYMDYRNKGFSDKNAVLYGHNMKNGTMFSQLKKIYNNELGENVKISIYTPDGIKEYRVFSTYTIKPDDFSINMTKNEMKRRSKVKFNTVVYDDDNVLTVFTCTDTMLERIIVHAVQESGDLL